MENFQLFFRSVLTLLVSCHWFKQVGVLISSTNLRKSEFEHLSNWQRPWPVWNMTFIPLLDTHKNSLNYMKAGWNCFIVLLCYKSLEWEILFLPVRDATYHNFENSHRHIVNSISLRITFPEGVWGHSIIA